MGNNISSNRDRNIDQSDIVQYPSGNNTNVVTAPENISEYHNEADAIYEKLSKQPYIEKKYTEVIYDPVKGTAYPYESPHHFGSETSPNPVASSEGPKFVEFICQNNDAVEKERYAVNHETPNHDCRCNCECIDKIVELRNEDSRTILYPLSTTSSDPVDKNAASKTCNLKGGAKKNSNDSDIFSDTSDIDTKVDKKNNKKNKKNKNDDDDDDDDEVLDMEDEDEPADDDDDNLEEDADEDDDDMEELENIEDEEIAEDGILFEQSDITSSDLYRMQSRVFGSETDTEYGNNDDDDNLESDYDFTEQVRYAMDRINQRKTMFNSEDREILDMKSDKFNNKNFKKNNKYN